MYELSSILKKNKEEYIKNLLDFVAIDTQDIGFGIEGGREKEGQLYLQSLYEKMSVSKIIVDNMDEEIIQKSMKVYGEGNPNHEYKDRFNLYANFKGKDGPSIMFNGHVDTMPYGELSLWDNHPHKPIIKDGKMYGLGACDMKAGLMAAIMAVKLLQDAKIDLPGDVIITSVVDEEGGGNGSIQAAINGQHADGVVVCEPTDDELIVAHMGFVFLKVEVEGKANHSGSKWLGVSAIDKAMKLIDALTELEHDWLMKYKHPLLPAPSLNVGTIIGGNGASTVAGQCTFEVCIHYLPDVMSKEKIEEIFKETIINRSMGDDWLKNHIPKISTYQSGGAFEMERDHSFVNSFTNAYNRATDKDIKIVGSPAGCDSRIWHNIAKCPTIQFGPGRLEQCHAINEYVEVDKYLEAIIVYANLILNWCDKDRI